MKKDSRVPFADLHCHSTFSDGSCSSEEILNLAIKKGFKALSITDHDTVGAYTDLYNIAQALGLKIVTGAEFSCVHHTHSVHVLGYGFDLDSPTLLHLIKRHQERRLDRNRLILKKLEKAGMPLAEEEVSAQGASVIGRPHIALALVKKGYVDSPLTAFRKYLGEGKLCWEAGDVPSVTETLEIIKQSKGKAILAHPHLLKNPSLLTQLLQLPFDGMECYYANFSAEQNHRWIDLCHRKNWLKTGGSDFHGTLKPSIEYGASYVDEEQFNLL